MLNDRLKRVQIGRDNEVPIEDNRQLWFLLIYEKGWDACTITDEEELVNELKRNNLKYIFTVWHGQHRTNLFLMDKRKLLKRINRRFGN